MSPHTSQPAPVAPAAVDPIGPNIEVLRRTLAFVERLSDAQFVHVETRLAVASIGAHVRHVLDHYRLFLEGLPRGEVDYDARERDTAIELSTAAAAAETRRLIGALGALGAGSSAGHGVQPGERDRSWSRRPLRVRQQAADEPGRFDGCESHAERELLFLQSHAVHHQAVIAILARAQGVAVPDTFGLAPSTATWQRAQRGGSACAR